MKDDMSTNPKPNQPNKESTPLYWLYQWEEWHIRVKNELWDIINDPLSEHGLHEQTKDLIMEILGE